MTERDYLLRAVLEDPTDDLPRLAYADWLEEYGHAQDLLRAQFIRAQCRKEDLPYHLQRYVDKLGLVNSDPGSRCVLSVNKGQAGAYSWDETGGTVLTRLRGVSLCWTRGFVSRVLFPKEAWTDETVRAVFSHHPVEAAAIQGVRPSPTLMSHDGTSGFFRMAQAPEWPWGGGYNPAALSYSLWTHVDLVFRRNRQGWNAEKALQALSDALVRHGRALAGLPVPPLPEPDGAAT